MQLVVAIALTAFYVGLALALGGVHPEAGMPWWFFAPGAISMGAGALGTMVTATLTVPWAKERSYEPPPRPVHLSWRAAIWLPAWAPAALLPWHFLWIRGCIRISDGRSTSWPPRSWRCWLSWR